MNRIVPALAAAALAFVAQFVEAAGQRSFVSASGVDNPNCSLGSPCRTFVTAIATTNAGGEIIVLDSGGYGGVTIGKAISIIAPPGVYAGISVFGGDGITINAGGSDRVILRGLAINAQGVSANSGIAVTSAGSVELDRVAITGFPTYGVDVDVSATLTVSVHDSSFNGNYVNVRARGASLAATPRVIVTDSSITGGTNGVQAADQSVLVVANTTIAGSSTCVNVAPSAGTLATAVVKQSRLYNCTSEAAYPGNTTGTSFVELIDSIVEYSLTGLLAGGNSTSRIERTTFSHNNKGIDTASGGIVESPQNNVIRGNGTDGAPTATFALQ